MSREKEFSKNLFILSIGTFLPKLAYFITLPILTGYLTKNEYGTYDLIVTCVSFLLPIITLQLQAAAFRFLIGCRNNIVESKKVISNVLGFTVICATIMNIVLMVVLSYSNVKYFIIICLYFWVEIILRTIQQIIRGLSFNALYTVGTIVESVINLILVICTVFFKGQGLFGVLISVTIADLIEIFILTAFSKIHIYFDCKYISHNELKKLLAYSWPMVPNNLCLWVINFSDRYVVTYFMGTSANAIYAAATKIPSMLTIVQTVFMYAWQENASIVAEDADADEYYSKMFNKIYRVLCGALSVIVALTPVLFAILIRGDYQESYGHISILLMSELFHGISIFAAGICVAKKKTKEIAETAFFSMIINLLFDLAFVKIIGIYAASISTLISYIFIAVYRMIGAGKYSGMKVDKKSTAWLLLGCVLLCILSYQNIKWLNYIIAIIGIAFAVFVNKSIIVKMKEEILNVIHKKRKVAK